MYHMILEKAKLQDRKQISGFQELEVEGVRIYYKGAQGNLQGWVGNETLPYLDDGGSYTIVCV